MVFPYRLYCKRQQMLQIFLHFCFCVATGKLLQSLRFIEILLLNYYSAGVIEPYKILKHCRAKPYLSTIPNYNLF